MRDFIPTEGEHVRIDIPDKCDPDHDSYHGLHGQVTVVFSDDAEEITGDELDNNIYRVEFNDGSSADFRHHDLRPPIE